MAIVALTLGQFGYFFLVVRTPLFWPWEGPITPLGPATVLMDRKDLNLTKTKQNKIVAVHNLLSPKLLHRSSDNVLVKHLPKSMT